jgi:hypothetical protein
MNSEKSRVSMAEASQKSPVRKLEKNSSTWACRASTLWELGLALFVAVAPADTVAQSAGDWSRLTEAQVRRGQALRKVLTMCVDFASAHTNRWPKGFGELEAAVPRDVNYVASKAVNRGLAAAYMVGAVCHERLDAHPGGVWVAYTDSHLEFVQDEAALRAALTQAELEKVWTNRSALASSVGPALPESGATLKLRLVDESGRPVADARVGTEMTQSPEGGYKLTFARQPMCSRITDNAGNISVPAEWLFSTNVPRPAPIPVVAFHRERRLIGLRSVSPGDCSTVGGDKPRETLELKMQRGIRVACRLSCIEKFRPPRCASIRVSLLSATGPGSIMCEIRDEPVFEFILPRGDFAISADIPDAYGGNRLLQLADETREVNLHLDLAPTRLNVLAGQPAPELRQVRGWTNGAPVTLAQLRGHWVVLDFWQGSAWPWLPEIPDLIKLHGRFAAKGLVIIAIHDDSLETMEELGQRLRTAPWEVWSGRAVPFRVALGGGGPTAIPGTRLKVRGVMHALYGVNSWPTTVLIDPAGRVVGSEQVPDISARLEKLFGAAEKAERRDNER